MLSDLFDVVSYYNQDQGTRAMAAENKLNAILWSRDTHHHQQCTALGDIHKVRTQPNRGPTKYDFILRTMGEG